VPADEKQLLKYKTLMLISTVSNYELIVGRVYFSLAAVYVMYGIFSVFMVAQCNRADHYIFIL